MKILKRILIGFATLLIVLVAAALILPRIYKNEIKSAVDKELAKTINADVVYNVEDFSLTWFRHFPDMTVEVQNLGVFNRAPFEGVHLFVVESLGVEVNPLDILFGKQMRLKGITLIRPQINVTVLKDGRANYDIAFPSKDTSKTANQEPTRFSFGIDHWEVVDGDVTYDDLSLTYFLNLKGLNHTGNGDFTQDVFDLRTHSVADTVTSSFGGMELMTNKHVSVDAIMAISEGISKFTFKQGVIKVNEFAMNCEGWFKMNSSDYGMDLTFKAPDNSFKSLLSLAPGIYSKNFGKIETKGELSFSGAVKGTYSDKALPAFRVTLAVNDGMFKYPGLPAAVTNINMDLTVDNGNGVLENTLVDLKKLHLDFGSNPVDARLLIRNLKNYKMEGSLKASLNLTELNTMFPMQGTEMSGRFTVNATANGIYDSIRKIVPDVSGTLSLHDFKFKSREVPFPVSISTAEVTLDPKKVQLKQLAGTVGKSDFDANGVVNNYIGYLLKKEVVQGTATFHSTLFDLTEFMPPTPTKPAASDTSTLRVIPVPGNIDFAFNTAIKTIKLMDYTITDATGNILVRDGVANLTGVRFNLLGGIFAVNGLYGTKVMRHPIYDVGLKIENLSFKEAANGFTIVRKLAPIAGSVNGKFGLDFKLKGELKQNMTPDLATLSGAGMIRIAEASLNNSTLVSGITALTKLENTDQVSLKDVSISANIVNGQLTVKPFDVKFGNYKTNISGSTSLGGAIDYLLKMSVPAGKAGAELQGFVNQYTGSHNTTSEIPVTIGIRGTYDKPVITLNMTEQKQLVQEAVKQAAEQKGKEALQKAVKGTQAEQAVNSLLGLNKKDSTKAKDSTQNKPADQVNQLLQNKLQNLLKRKKK